ncbi:hypothetical protein ACP70R_034415 [Stipagrostis hirtigluma subsp. patula]
MDTPKPGHPHPNSSDLVVPDSQTPDDIPTPRPLFVLTPRASGNEIVPVRTPPAQTNSPAESLFYDFDEATNKEKCLMPVTLAMVNRALHFAGSKPLTINRTEISTVRIVGRVLDIKISDIKATFLIDDGTFTLHGNYWLSSDQWSADEFSKISNGNYANIVGRVVRSDGLDYIQAFSCRFWKINDYNEITNHFLYVIKAHLDLCGKPVTAATNLLHGPGPNSETLPPQPADPNGHRSPVQAPANSRPPSPPDTALHVLTIKQNPTQTADDQECSDGPDTDISSPTLLRVIKDLSKDAEMTGVTIHEIIKVMNCREEEIRPALSYLCSVGDIYSTVDEDHFRPT